MWEKRKVVSDKVYNVEDFNYLLGTKHIDPDDGFEYIVRAVRKAKGLIVVDRQLSGSTSKKYDTIHALDIQRYYIATQGVNTGGPVVDQGLAITPQGHRYSGGGPARSDNPAREGLITRPAPSTVSGIKKRCYRQQSRTLRNIDSRGRFEAIITSGLSGA